MLAPYPNRYQAAKALATAALNDEALGIPVPYINDEADYWDVFRSIRCQTYLPPEQELELRQRARAARVSLSTYVRRAAR